MKTTRVWQHSRPSPGSVLRPFLSRQWRALVVASAATLAVTLAELAQPFPLKLVIDRLFRQGRDGAIDLDGHDLNVLALVASLVLVIALVDALAQYWMDVSLERAGERIVHDLRVATYAQLQRLSLAFHERRHAGDLVTRVTGDVNAVGDMFSSTAGTIVSSALLLVGMAIVTFVLDPVVAVAAFCVTPVLAFVTFRFRRRLRKLSRQQRQKEGEIASMATETLSAMRVVKAFGSGDLEHGRLRRTSEARRAFGIETAQLEGRYSGVVDVLGAVGAAAALAVGVFRVSAGHLSPGDLVVVTSYARKVYRPLRAIARQASKVSQTMARAERVVDVLASDEMLADLPSAYRGPRATGELCFDDVSFAYEPDRPALQRLSLSVAAGEKVAIVGRSGAGKSTVAALVARFYDPDQGRVLLDGRDMRESSLAWVRDQVALVLQDTVLFTGDITENISYGHEAPAAKVIAAAKAAGAHAFITQLPEGYDAALGPRGVGLSGGQRQRIAIARTLLRDPPVLVLDEPTTGLDAEAEAHVLRGLDVLMRGRTTILITHSLALAQKADRVVVVDKGRVVQEGPPNELLAEHGPFRRLAREQGLVVDTLRRGPVLQDDALPQLPALLDADAVAPVLGKLLVVPPDSIDVRVRWLRYRPGRSLLVHYDVGADGAWHEAVVVARRSADLAKLVRRADNVALARRVDGRSPASVPLAHDADLDVLVQWLPLDVSLPLLAEPTDELRRLLREAGVRVATAGADVTILGYRPGRRAVLRLGDHVLNTYAAAASFDAAVRGLRAGADLHGIRTARFEAALPDVRLTVQSALAGRRPSRPADVAADAGALLDAVHHARLDGLGAHGPAEQLAAAARPMRLVTAVAPRLASELEMLLGTLELTAPPLDVHVVSHGDFKSSQLLEQPDGLAVVNFDGLRSAPAAFDLATYAAQVVRGDPDDLDDARQVLDLLLDGYGDAPPDLDWWLATAILRRVSVPFRYLDDDWSGRVGSMVAAAEAAVR